MGLDMYLTRKVYIGAEYEHRKVTGTIDIQIEGKPVDIEFKKVSYIEERAAYWRKANQIHNWFVQNVQGGVDECQPSDVSIEQLRELVEICKKVKAIAKLQTGQIANGETMTETGWQKNLQEGSVVTNAEEIEELLPTQGGFFFGGTEYDEWYMRDIDSTIEQLEPYITDEKYKFDEFEYRASW